MYPKYKVSFSFQYWFPQYITSNSPYVSSWFLSKSTKCENEQFNEFLAKNSMTVQANEDEIKLEVYETKQAEKMPLHNFGIYSEKRNSQISSNLPKFVCCSYFICITRVRVMWMQKVGLCQALRRKKMCSALPYMGKMMVVTSYKNYNFLLFCSVIFWLLFVYVVCVVILVFEKREAHWTHQSLTRCSIWFINYSN